jgi:hypothetical protein
MGDGDDELPPPPPFRPWRASGVPHPGADRPRATRDLDTGDDVLPDGASRPAGGYAVRPGAAGRDAPGPMDGTPGTRPASATPRAAHTRTNAGSRLASERYVVGLAVLSAITAWLPWFKSPGASMFELTGSTSLFATVTAWDMPARYLWSSGARSLAGGGIELGWLVVGLPVLLVVGCIRGWSFGALRAVAATQVGVAVLFMVQTYRLLHDSIGSGGSHIGATDLIGLGPYVLLALSIGLLLAPRR